MTMRRQAFFMGLLLVVCAAPAQARKGSTTRIRAALAQELGVERSQVRFRSHRMGGFSHHRSTGERRFVQWKVPGGRGTAEIGMTFGSQSTTVVMNLHRGKGVNARKTVGQLAARFGGDPDLYHSLRSSPVAPQEACWSSRFPGPRSIMKTVGRTKGLQGAIHYELRLGRQLVGYATDLHIGKGKKVTGKRVFYDPRGRVVQQRSFVPPQ
jgi:hypothetical protein